MATSSSAWRVATSPSAWRVATSGVREGLGLGNVLGLVVLDWSVVRGALWLHALGEGQVQRMKPLMPN